MKLHCIDPILYLVNTVQSIDCDLVSKQMSMFIVYLFHLSKNTTNELSILINFYLRLLNEDFYSFGLTLQLIGIGT